MNWDNGGLILYFGQHAIQISVLTIAIFVVAFVAAFVVLNMVVARRRRPCNWKRAQDESRPPFTKWQCKTCAMEAYSTDKRPPKECKRLLKPVV